MPRIKFKEAVSIDGIRYEKDNTHDVSDDVAKTVTENGWGDDLDGKLKTGVRDIHPKVLAVKSVKQSPSMKKA